MTHFSRIARLIVVGTMGALLVGAIAACSQGPTTAKKVLMACLALPDTAAGQITGESLTGLKLSGTGSPVHICQYVDNNTNNVSVLLQISPFKGKDAAAELAQDAATQKGLFKNNIVPAKINPASGFGTGAFYLDNTISPTATAVQLHLIMGGHKIMLQINNPKDFATGEKQAAELTQKALDNIQNGSAFQPITTNG